jgi:hypothetical protein
MLRHTETAMALDLLDLGTLIDIFLARRFFVPFAIGVAGAIAFYYLTGETPASAAVAFFIGLVGFIAGIVFQIAGSRPGSV